MGGVGGVEMMNNGDETMTNAHQLVQGDGGRNRDSSGWMVGQMDGLCCLSGRIW